MGLRRRVKTRHTRILFVTDLHGSEAVFRKFLNAVPIYEADVAIIGGDLTGKRIVPIVQRADGSFAAEFSGAELLARGEAELGALRQRISDAGQYPIAVSETEFQRLCVDDAFVEATFRKACVSQVRDWMNRAAERLEPLAVPVFVTGGNDDYLVIEDVLNDAPYVQNAEGQVKELSRGVEMISTGYGNPTPWQCPRDIPEVELSARIAEMAARLTDPKHAVFNLHVPPLGSALDLCPKLDTSVSPPRPIIGEEAPAGSVAVRDAIAKFAPMLSLHGHIHESAGIRGLGATTSINPGSEYGEGILRSAVIDLTDGTVGSAQLLTA
jgi:Icc-related predicted phosphoesterase